MARYYALSAHGFFDSEIHTNLPADAVEISEDEHHALLDAQTKGLVIEADENGFPVARARVASPEEQQASLAHQARLLLRESDVEVLLCYERGVPVPATWVSYRDELRAVVAGTRSTLPEAPAS